MSGVERKPKYRKPENDCGGDASDVNTSTDTLYFNPNMIYNWDSEARNDDNKNRGIGNSNDFLGNGNKLKEASFFGVQDEYVPDLDFTKIVDYWNEEGSQVNLLKQNREARDIPDDNRKKEVVLPSSSGWSINDYEERSLVSNDEYNLEDEDINKFIKTTHAKVEPIPLPNLKNIVTPPSALEVQRRSSYTNYRDNLFLKRRSPISLPVDLASESFSSISQYQPRTYLANNQLTQDDIKRLISCLPHDYINLPYSQRKRKILEVLPNDKVANYKAIMALIKKHMISTSKSNSSLAAYSAVSNNDSVNNNNSTTNNDNNSSFVEPNDAIRHGSIASQFLSSFSPSVTSIISLNDSNDKYSTTNNAAASSIFKPDDKGMQLFNHTLGKIIGFGAWGMIRECVDNSSGVTNAIKIMRFKNNEKIKSQVIKEVSVWKLLKHKNILPLLDYKLDDSYAMYCLTKKISDGTLYDLVISWDDSIQTRISIDQRCEVSISLSMQVINALEYIHSMRVIHGDIKLENCLIDKRSKYSKDWNVLLCDFGMSCFFSNALSNKTYNDSNIGSLPYASPELVNSNVISVKADIWAFGVMLYTMLVGKLPFKHDSETRLKELIRQCKYDKEALHSICNGKFEQLGKIVMGCLQLDMQERWNLSKIKNTLESLL